MTGKEALERLGLPSWPLPDADAVRRAYKVQAGIVHPDVGGTAEDFAYLHRAYQLALKVAAAGRAAAQFGIEAPRCPACDGGYITIGHLGRQLRIVCGACGGTGECGEDEP